MTSYISKTFGVHLTAVRAAMEDLASRFDPQELNRIGFRLYEQFRPDVPPDARGWGRRAGWASGRYALPVAPEGPVAAPN